MLLNCPINKELSWLYLCIWLLFYSVIYNSENTEWKAQYVLFPHPEILRNIFKKLYQSFPEPQNIQTAQNYFCVSFTGNLVQTSLRSAPILWLRLMLWLNFRGPTSRIIEKKPKFKDLKHKNIPELNDYSVVPESSYWEKFPFKELPTKPTTKVDTDKLMSSYMKENIC